MKNVRLLAVALRLIRSALAADASPAIGLITKTETNAFFVEMRRGRRAGRARGLAVVLISHDMPKVYDLADRIHVAPLGRRVAVLDPRRVQMSDAVAVMTGARSPDDLP